MNRRQMLLSAGAAAVGLLLSRPAAAAFVPVAQADEADLRRVESYLTALRSARGRFVQRNPSGIETGGSYALLRPGHVRFAYDPPNPTLLLADGLNVILYDRELQEASMVPLSATPLWFLLRDQVDFEDGVTVTGIERAPGRLSLQIVQTGEADQGSLQLDFSEDPLRLRRWIVEQPQGGATEVTLQTMETGVRLNPADFRGTDLPGVGYEDRSRNR